MPYSKIIVVLPITSVIQTRLSFLSLSDQKVISQMHLIKQCQENLDIFHGWRGWKEFPLRQMINAYVFVLLFTDVW